LRLSAKQNRLSAFHSFGNNKFPFSHSPNSPIHPDHNGTTVNTLNDLRSQINQRVCQRFSSKENFLFYLNRLVFLKYFNDLDRLHFEAIWMGNNI